MLKAVVDLVSDASHEPLRDGAAQVGVLWNYLGGKFTLRFHHSNGLIALGSVQSLHVALFARLSP